MTTPERQALEHMDALTRDMDTILADDPAQDMTYEHWLDISRRLAELQEAICHALEYEPREETDKQDTEQENRP